MGERRTRILFTLFLVLLDISRLSAFNLDTDNVLQMSGEPGSLFGFSLAMHRQLLPQDKRVLLVGAPRANSLPRQQARVTGGLYSCDFNPASFGCVRVIFDNEEDQQTESKENQWMGATVNSQGPGGKVVVCAHRYQKRDHVSTPIESRDIVGRCYVLGQDLTDSGTEEEGGNWCFCNGRNRGHEMFGSCQQGMSATFDKDYHYIIFGAPGAYNWKGVVHMEQRNFTLMDLGYYNDGPFETGGETTKNPDLVPAVDNSYLGFALDSGKALTQKGQLTVVAGAPRANHSGSVVMLKKASDDSDSLVHEYTLDGEGLASSFGYDLTVLDLNMDGWQDLVVGAPQYFEKDGEIGGAVYVFINKGGKWNKATRERIDGPQDSMFGLAVENLGDINQDRFQDFAVGAPYADDGIGSVFIYHGSAEGLRSRKAAQVLSGKSVGTLFGYSLAGNMDLDMNSYPDLAVGSLSDTVYLFRARPVLSIQKEIKIKPKELDLTKKNCGDKICLDIEACFSYVANPKNYNPRLTLMYSFVVEADRRKKTLPPRVLFSKRTPGDSDYESTGSLTLTGQGSKECITQKLTLQDNFRDKLRGIPIDVSVDLQTSKRRRRQSSGGSVPPVLDANEPITARAEVNFVKAGCGTDNICQSNLAIRHRYCYREPNTDNFTPIDVGSGENSVPEISLSNQKEIALQVIVTNHHGDDAYEASVIASFPPSLSYSAFRPALNSTGQVSCKANTNGSEVVCELDNPFKRGSQVVFYIILSTSAVSLSVTELEIDLRPETTSEQQKLDPVKAKARVVIELLLSVTGQAQPSQVYYSGEVKGESAMKTESDPGSAIRYQFRIINLGKPLKNFGNASLVIKWPKETTEAKWLLYLMKITSKGVEQVSCSSSKEINPLGLKEEPTPNRVRRSLDDSNKNEEGTISLLSKKRTYDTLSCDKGAKCVELRCPLRGFDSNAVITLYSRLWNGTFLENYSKLNYLDVIVNAELHMDGKAKNMKLKNAATQVRVTVFPERQTAQYGGGMPWWVILVAILLGLLLLGLLVFLLWKCGFFGQNDKEDNPSDYEKLRPDA